MSGGGLRPGAAPFTPGGGAGGATATGGGNGGNDNDAKLAALAARFPSFPFQSLKEVLEATGGDLKSAEMLVESIAGSARAAGAAAAAAEERQQRHQQQLPLPTAAAFPSLGGGGGGAAIPPRAAVLSLPPLRRKAEAATDFLRDEESFPALGAKRPEQRKNETERLQGASSSSFAAVALSADPREAEAAARAAAAAAAARAAPPLSAAAGASRRNDSDGSAAAVPWVSTGAAVSGQYAEARERARALCVARNVAFDQATQAYLRGDKAAAKELGAKGRGLAAEMRSLHEQAAAVIFESRNNNVDASRSSSRSSDSGVITIDLHGLHVAEAVAAVERAVERAREEKKRSSGNGRGGAAATRTTATTTTTFNLIVGVGKHTTHGAGQRARLPLAVKGKLDELGVEWEEGTGSKGVVTAFV